MKYKDPITGEYKELFLKASDTLPIGSIVPYGSNDIPENWLLCDGRAVSRTTYANLFSVIGTNFGEGDGTTTFNLPDFRTRVPVGLYSEDTDFDTIGNAGGEKEHTLTIEEMPTHSHQFLFDQTPGSNINVVQAGGASAWSRDTTTSGNDQPHNIMQPYQVVNYIIKSAMSVGVIGNVLNNKSDSKKDTYSCNYLNKNILTATLSTYQATSQAFNKVNLDSKVSVGDKLTLINNGIKIGAGITKVKVSAGVGLAWNSPISSDFHIYITKNGAIDGNVIIKVNGSKSTDNTATSVILSEQLIEVQENDILYLCLYATVGSNIYGPSRATYMTVEVVE